MSGLTQPVAGNKLRGRKSANPSRWGVRTLSALMLTNPPRDFSPMCFVPAERPAFSLQTTWLISYNNFMEKFTTWEPFSFAWQKARKHLWFVVLSALGVLVVTGIFNISDSNKEELSAIESLLSLVGFIVSIFVHVGVIRLALKLLDDVRGGVQDFLPTWRIFWHLLLGGVLYGLVVGFGTLLLIFPGVIWGLRYGQMFYLVVDRDMGPIEAMKMSAKMTYGYKKRLFLVCLVSIGVVIVGALVLLVGLLVALPMVVLAWAYIYRKLSITVPETVNPIVPSEPKSAVIA